MSDLSTSKCGWEGYSREGEFKDTYCWKIQSEVLEKEEVSRAKSERIHFRKEGDASLDSRNIGNNGCRHR